MVRNQSFGATYMVLRRNKKFRNETRGISKSIGLGPRYGTAQLFCACFFMNGCSIYR